jgi:predicted SprT family Zn-dependent metalloprotease
MSSYANAARELSAELLAAALRELAKTYQTLNYTHFREALRQPSLEISDAESRLGQWMPALRSIQISRRLLLEHPWGVVVEVLKHEMAHQYAHEVLGAWDETAHGKAFQQVCERLGVDAAASGLPRVATRSEEEERILGRIAKLLALAESANENEAQAAMSAAQRLMLKHNLQTPTAPREYGHRQLGEPSGRVNEAERILANILCDHFFVEAIWVPVYRPLEGKRASVLEICGAQGNLELAAYVHSFLRDTAARLWDRHKAEANVPGNKDRQRFVSGVMIGFREKLRDEAKKSKKEGLVWVKDGNLDGFFRKRHPRVRHVRYQGAAPSEAHAKGREAGRQIVLHRPVNEGAGSRGRLLPPARGLRESRERFAPLPLVRSTERESPAARGSGWSRPRRRRRTAHGNRPT